MREYKLEILGYGPFVMKVPIPDIQYHQAWLKDVKVNLHNIRTITKEQERIEEDMFLQAATECEKDFYYLKDDIKIEELHFGKNETREYYIFPVCSGYTAGMWWTDM